MEMEHIKIPNYFANSCYYDEKKDIRFDPPVYEQRYSTVLRLLDQDCWKSSFKKIVEFGCAEMKFFRLLRSLPDVEKILELIERVYGNLPYYATDFALSALR